MYFNGWCKMHFWASKWQDSKELCTAWLVESGIGFAVSIHPATDHILGPAISIRDHCHSEGPKLLFWFRSDTETETHIDRYFRPIP